MKNLFSIAATAALMGIAAILDQRFVARCDGSAAFSLAPYAPVQFG